jgi:hypothetical protein
MFLPSLVWLSRLPKICILIFVSLGVIIEPWDYRYYAEKVRIAQFDLDMDLVKPYFQLDRLREAMFWCAERLFGINFSRVDLPVYHADVKVWEVKDGGKHVGLWYFDPYARKGKKSGRTPISSPPCPSSSLPPSTRPPSPTCGRDDLHWRVWGSTPLVILFLCLLTCLTLPPILIVDFRSLDE